jgi:hypothetical protein
MDQYNIIQEYMEIHLRSMTPKLMHLAFSTTGIFPFNDALFIDNNFAPAKSFSHTMHIPESFPAEVPSSPPVALDVSDLETLGNESESDAAESMAADDPAEQTHHSWDTDSDDFDYASHLSSPAAAATPPNTLPCQFAMSVVPITGTIASSSLLMPTMLPTSTISASCSLPITPITPPIPALLTTGMSHYVGASGSPRPSDAFSDNVGPYAIHASPYYTCSQVSQMASLSLGSSPTLSISITLDPSQAPQPQSIEELLLENRHLWMTLDLIEKENTKLKANNNASNAHYTIITRAATVAKANLNCQKRKTHRAVKTSACYVAHPAIEDEWNASQQEKAWHAKEATETEAQKAMDEALREACIQVEMRTRTFSSVC